MIRYLIFVVFSISILLSQDKKQELKKIDKKVKKKKQVVFSNNENSSEYLDLFDESFEKLKINFVDSVNESELIKSGIKGMMKNLDPYTKLLEGSSLESYDILRKGTIEFIENVRDKDLSLDYKFGIREVKGYFVIGRLMTELSQHLGQVSYIRGMIRGLDKWKYLKFKLML